MYLKSLTLKGFKSFADRAHLVFEPGLTVIVGPNGSGKSNISDAILWVLGEQSAKSLRGQVMEDVIFSGSSARSAVSLAEVDLTLDNSDHTLPVDYDEVVITRRMYRSGESEYLINGTLSRLLDITDILHDSGLGKDTHSIISQGKLDEVLTSRPEDRRGLIEEAAGILKHKRRRERSERKLAAMDDHLERAQRIQHDINRRLRPLERQVEAARRADSINERAQYLRTLLAVDDLRDLQSRWNDLVSSEQCAADELAASEVSLRSSQEEAERLSKMLDDALLTSTVTSEQQQHCQRLQERFGSEIRLLDEKIRNARMRLSELQGGHTHADERAQQIASEIAAAQTAYEANHAQQDEIQQLIETQRHDVQLACDQRHGAEQELEQLRSQLDDAAQAQDTASNLIAKTQEALARTQREDDLLAERIEQYELSRASASDDAAQAARNKASIEEELKEASDEVSALQKIADDALADLEQQRMLDTEAKQALADTEAQLQGLQRALHAGEDAVPLAARLSETYEGEAAPLRVHEIFDVPDDLTDVVERLLGARLTAFVVEDGSSLRSLGDMAERLAEGSDGQIEIFDASAIREGGSHTSDSLSLPGYVLLDRIGVDENYRPLASYILGDVRIVDTFAAACAAAATDPDHTYATPVGDHIAAGGHAVVGHAVDTSAGLLNIQHRLHDLSAALSALQERAATAQDKLRTAEDTRSDALRKLEDARMRLAQLKQDATDAAAAEDRARHTHDDLTSQLEHARAERTTYASSIQQAHDDIEHLAHEIAEAQSTADELSQGLSGAQRRFDEARKAERNARDKVTASQLDLASLQGRASGIEDQLQRLTHESADLQQRLEHEQYARRQAQATCERMLPLRERYVQLQECASDRGSMIAVQLAQADQELSGLRQAADDARIKASAAQDTYNAAFTHISDIRVDKGRLDVQVEAAVKAITDVAGMILEEALELPAPEDRGADEAELARLESELLHMGPVNQVAEEEYGSLKARADYIAAQIDDLQHARSDLNKILTAIDRKMRSSFLATFDEVDHNFQEIFAMLFPGGSAHLEMTDPDDPDTTGIEVIAQPQGKHITKMSLLSGGERSLTALGLLFAVYHTRTVPFYVLDEVEAALDDSNLDRFLGALDTLRQTTQLIVITHQRRTMESADVLYGVSMQADGVSHVVSQKLDHEGSV